MSSTVPSKRDHLPNTLAKGGGALTWFQSIFTTTIGTKVIVACTAILLTGFVVAHMIGNLKIFAGRDSINAYAKFLKDLGPLLWIARGGLLLMFVLHVVLVLRLKARSSAARPEGYAYPGTIQATAASRFMLMSGLVILAFVIFHLAHYTFGVVKPAIIDGKAVNYLDLHDASGRHDVYTMVVKGFQDPLMSVLYLVAQWILFLHLSHGIGSVFQTLGLNSPRFQKLIKRISLLVALTILAGNTAIVVAVWGGWIS
jgi:succinate dehydrogenase / fumarate reductase cytochrome b subunit